MNRRFFVRLLFMIPFVGLLGFVKTKQHAMSGWTVVEDEVLPTEHGIPDPTEGIRDFIKEHKYYRETIHCGYTIKDGRVYFTKEQFEHYSSKDFSIYMSDAHQRMLTEYDDD